MRDLRFTRLALWATAFLATACGNRNEEPPRGGPAAQPALQRAEKPKPPPQELQNQGDLGYGEDARLFDTLAEAMQPILASKPKVIGFGEYHKLENSPPVRSALHRFSHELMDTLGPKTAHLILETWNVDPECGKQGEAVSQKVAEVIQRPKQTENELQVLMRKAQEHGIKGHILQFSCSEYNALLQPRADRGKGAAALDAEALLAIVTKKLGEKAVLAYQDASASKMTIIYGGATHNNLFPYPGLEDWSYGKELAAATNNSFVEVDLYVPELVQDDPVLAQEAWFPLMKEARNNQVILIRRDPNSYILLMRKAYPDAPARAADKPGSKE